MMLLLFLALACLVSSKSVNSQPDTGEIKPVADGQPSDFLLPETDPGQNSLGWQVQEGQDHLQHQSDIVNNHQRKRPANYMQPSLNHMNQLQNSTSRIYSMDGIYSAK
ncbi:unnamed protein product, partial [Rotaria sp. Silwood2]